MGKTASMDMGIDAIINRLEMDVDIWLVVVEEG